MCGIAGAVNWGGADALRRMTDIQAHRGPDDSGVLERSSGGDWFGLGSRRLAIVDLSRAGHMPMASPTADLWIVYNGEVYNCGALRSELEARGHTFHSRTDTEVVLRLYEEYGPECLRRLNGIFAFAILDLRAEPTVFLARDHFGVKPLYYSTQEGKLGFASEAKALLELPGIDRSISLQALDQYMTFLWVPDPLTLFGSIRKLPAGHYGVFKGGRLTVKRYWDLSFPPEGNPFSEDENRLIDEVRARVCASVESQLMSDVPVGAFLSAGLDSSSIVAAMSRVKRPIRTYTITFPSEYRMGESNLDDPKVAARIAESLGAEHTEIVVKPDVVSLLPKLVWHMDEPVADPAIITAFLVCREAKKSSTVLLSGVGGDEVFGGYRKYQAVKAAKTYQRIPAGLRTGLLEPTLRSLPVMGGTRYKELFRWARKWGRSASLPPTQQFISNGTYLDAVQKRALYSPALLASSAAWDPAQRHLDMFARASDADWLSQLLYVDSKLFLNSLNLNYNDKMSMANSVEVRVPLIDRELAEWVAWNIPTDLKIKGRVTKHILRRAMEPLLPKEALTQPKASFGAPVGYWIERDLQELCRDLLSPDRVRARGWFSPATVTAMLEDHLAGTVDWSLQIWQLLTLELWAQRFLDEGVEAGCA